MTSVASLGQARGRRWVPRTLLYVAVTAILAMLWARQRGGGPAEDAPAPEFSLPRVDEATHSRMSLGSLRGRPVFIEVFASWCSGCRRAAPVVAELHREHGRDRVRFVGISLDDSAALAREAARDWQIPFPVLVDDGSFARDYGIQTLPTFIAVDASGRVRHVATGVAWQTRLQAWLTAL